MSQHAKCIKCGYASEGTFCEKCGIVMPIPTDLNYFKLLGFEARPVIPDEQLKEAHLKLSQLLHPDKFQTRSKAELDLAIQWSSSVNKAYATLKDPAERIPYLVSLDTGKDPKLARTAAVSKWTLSLYQNVGAACQEADKLIAQKKTASRIVAATLVREIEKHSKDLASLKELSSQMRSRALADLEKIDVQWLKSTPEKKQVLIRLLSKMGGDLSYLAKVDSLLEERLLQLRI